MELRVQLREQPDGRWIATASRAGDAGEEPIKAGGATRDRCLAAVRRALARAPGGSEGLDLVVEVIPSLAGVAEAAAIMGWDKRRVITYIDRGRFPVPIQTLASGRVWLRDDVVRFAEEWHARRARRAGAAR
jgi:hypothetical protein